jgi:hypothetical protein
MTRRDLHARACATVLALGGFLAVGQYAWAFDSAEVYRQGAVVISGEGGYGAQLHLYDPFTGLEFANVGVRVGVLPFGTAGPGILQGYLLAVARLVS